MKLMLIGAIAMAALIISLFFFRFWRDTKDRFFLFFSIAFIAEGSSRILMYYNYNDEYEPFIYLVRLFAFMIIMLAIADKNRRLKTDIH